MNCGSVLLFALSLCFIFYVQCQAQGIHLTISPHGINNVQLQCKVLGDLALADVHSMSLSKQGTTEPLAVLTDTDKVRTHSRMANVAQTKGLLDSSKPSNSYMTVTLLNPSHLLSGVYRCSATAKDGKQADASATLFISDSGPSSIKKEIKAVQTKDTQAASQIESTKKLIDETRMSSNDLQHDLTENENQLSTLEQDLQHHKQAHLDAFLKPLKTGYKKLGNKESQIKSNTASIKTLQQSNKTNGSSLKDKKIENLELQTDKMTKDLKHVFEWLPGCPDNTWSASNNGYCYKTFGYQEWKGAHDLCATLKPYGKMVSITDAHTNNFLKDLGLVNEPAWIGLNDLDTEGQYKWADGTPFSDKTSFSKLTKTEYDEPKEMDCVIMEDDGSWHLEFCNVETSVLCQVERAVQKAHFSAQ